MLVATVLVPLILQLVQKFAQELVDALLDDTKLVLKI